MKKFSPTQRLVICAMMVAICLVLNRIVPATPLYHLSLDFLPIFIVAIFFGPVWALAAYGIADTLGSIILPFGPYNPGITVSLMLIGLVYGLVFYHRDLSSARKLALATAVAAVAVFLIKLFITTFFLYWMYGGESYLAYVALRVPNCLAILVANIVLLPFAYKLAQKLA